MMKKLVYLLLLIILVGTACKNKNRKIRLWHKHAEPTTTASEPESDDDATLRDYSITAENGYNDIFLDSLSFEKFITDHATSDSVTENMRDFYNVRNFEFAWFDSNGLTEQALGFRSLYKYSTDSVNKKLDQQLDNLLLHESSVSETDNS